MEDLYGRILFEGYSLVDGELVNHTSGKKLQDIEIEDLDLSVRGYNILKREGIHKVSDFIGMNTAAIMKFRNMGIGTVNELLLKLKEFEGGDIETTEPTVDKEIIAFRWQNKVVWDIPLDKVSLSVRSRNRMDLMQIKYVRQFLALENVSGITGLGQKSITELVELKKQLLDSAICGTEDERLRVLELFATAKSELKCLYTDENEAELDSVILSNIFEVSADESTLQRLLELIKSTPVFNKLIEIKVKAVIKESLFDGVTIEEIAKIIGFEDDDTTIANAVDKVISSGAAYKEYDKVFTVYPSIMEVINSLTRRETEVMTRRLNGETLEEIAKQYDFTRERIRQIVEKSYEKLFVKNKHADIIDYVKEDKYKYFFETYYLEQDDFCEMVSEAEYVWNYLTARYKNGNRKLSDALADDKLTLHLRYGIQRFLNKDFLIIGGQRIPLVRADLLEYVLATYCSNETSFEATINLYNNLLEDNNLSEKHKSKLFIREEQLRTVENKLSNHNKVLWKMHRRLRYYNIDDYDFTELLKTLNLGKYRNIELSTAKFFKELPELMRAYDIRDEYELHNLLRKIYPNDDYINFTKMPAIRFGEFDRDKAVLDAVFLLSPVTVDELVDFLSEEYGYRQDVIKAGWLSAVKLYYNNGIYTVDNTELPQEDFLTLKSKLTDEFYFIEEVREIYKSISKQYDESLISSYNLKRLGFTPYCNYIVKSTMSADAYFRKILTAEDVFDATEICSRLTSVSAFYSCLAELKASRQIIECEPYRFVSIRFLTAQGITENDLCAFCDEVYASVEENKLFTFKMLLNEGFTSPLQSLGFGDWFYASILREDRRFSFRKISSGVLFVKGNSKITRGTLFGHVFGDREKIEAAELINYIYENYGLIVAQDDVSQTVLQTSLYYDPLSKTIYRDFETYEKSC